MTDLPVASIGLRVRVVVVGEEPDPNLRGEIIRVEPIFFDDGSLFCEDYPTIRLDDGREMGGLDCWWTPDWSEA